MGLCKKKEVYLSDFFFLKTKIIDGAINFAGNFKLYSKMLYLLMPKYFYECVMRVKLEHSEWFDCRKRNQKHNR